MTDTPEIMFGGRVRQLRVERNLSLREFCSGTGLSMTHVSEFERGVRSPCSEKTISRIAGFLGADEPELQLLAARDRYRAARRRWAP